MDAGGKFGEHEKCVRVARGASVTDNCEWKAQNLRRKWRKSKLNELVSLKNVLKVKDPKLSRVLIVQNNIYAAVHGAIGEDRLKEIFKKCSRHLIYARACLNKDFVHSGSIGLI